MKDKSSIVSNWLPRYTGTPLEDFGQYVLLTNFSLYVELFAQWHNVEVRGRDKPMLNAHADGLSIINFGMGSPTAATMMDLLSAVMPRAVLFLGRHVGFPIALEGALKLKELAYIHAEGFAAGELKHGPIALIEAGQPVFVVVPSPRGSATMHAKVVSNIQEIRARGARVIAIAEQGDAAVLPFADTVIHIPLAAPLYEPLLAVVPLQVFAMELAIAKGLDVDQPRNLAKSVTVE